MAISKLEVMSKYFIGETALLAGKIIGGKDSSIEIKRYLNNVKDLPYETLSVVERFGYTASNYAFGAIMRSLVQVDGEISTKLSKAEMRAAEKFISMLIEKGTHRDDLQRITLSEDDKSSYYRYDDTITIGCKVEHLKRILKRSSLTDILTMTYLHEEGHRQDPNGMKFIEYLDKVIDMYGYKEVNMKSGKTYKFIQVPEKIFKYICKETVKSEVTAWRYAESVYREFNLNKIDLDTYKDYALFNYIKRHHKNMKSGKIKVADEYVFEAI